MTNKTKFEDLSTWLQVAIIWVFIQMGLTALMFFLYGLIGILS